MQNLRKVILSIAVIFICLPVLFLEEQKERNADYKELINGLKIFSDEIIQERRKHPNNDDLLEIDRKYSVKIKDHLKTYIPKLLRKRQWFLEVFPEKWSSDIMN